MTTVDWRRYLADYHGRRPGITERILGRAIGPHGETPYAWLVDPLEEAPGRVLDLACGSAPTRDLLHRPGWLGLDSSAAELGTAAAAGRGPLVRARADALPLPDKTVDVVTAAMCLQVLTPLDVVLAELRRVLRPGGTMVALVPSGVPPLAHISGVLAWVQVMRALRISSESWPNPQARDGLAPLLRWNRFVVESDRRQVFRREIANATEATLMIDGLYLPGVEPTAIARAKSLLASWACPGRWLPIPLRRVVTHLPSR
ncbi:class I SAM-dependent methyltransferase [Kribbella sancticallisti]|uniref:Class I SAM-dependent methyltransferase n=1 Tax=Kribbella sancticallisti TaxID=460087 RepID=A0ABN2DNW6_9ACTN